MNLTEEQKKTVASWVASGASLADVQRRLEDEMELRMTYMDVRFLIDDLEIDIPEAPKPAPPKPADSSAAGSEVVGADGKPLKSDTPSLGGGVSVGLDKIARPGALVSGQVTFSDGQSASWLLDQMGRLGLDGAPADYRPSDADMKSFQEKLQTALQQAGYA
jgi:hypothetical protein